MDSYTEYGKIENHMGFSKALFLIDKKGQKILDQLEAKKAARFRKNGSPVFEGDVLKVHNILSETLNVRKFSMRLYYELLYYLEEVMFKEINDATVFFVEEEQFELTRLYFDQSSWIHDQEVPLFEFFEGAELNIHEAMYLICFLREYEDTLLTLEDYIKGLDYKDYRRELHRIIGAIRRKHKGIWTSVIAIVDQKIDGST